MYMYVNVVHAKLIHVHVHVIFWLTILTLLLLLLLLSSYGHWMSGESWLAINDF